MIVRVTWEADGHSGDWNCDLNHPSLRRPLGKLSDRALDDAVFAANELRDAGPINDLREMRDRRREVLRDHFIQAAHKLAEQIEKSEGWPDWLSRLR